LRDALQTRNFVGMKERTLHFHYDPYKCRVTMTQTEGDSPNPLHDKYYACIVEVRKMIWLHRSAPAAAAAAARAYSRLLALEPHLAEMGGWEVQHLK
jgi:hypothetical protein